MTDRDYLPGTDEWYEARGLTKPVAAAKKRVEDYNSDADSEIAMQITMGKIERTFYVDQIRLLLRELDNGEISLSKFVEILNVEAEKNKNKTPNP